MPDASAPDPRQVLLEYTEAIHAWNAWLTNTISPRLPTPSSRPDTDLDQPHPFDAAGVPADDDRSLAVALTQIAMLAGGALSGLADVARDTETGDPMTRASIANLGEGLAAQAYIGDALRQRLHGT